MRRSQLSKNCGWYVRGGPVIDMFVSAGGWFLICSRESLIKLSMWQCFHDFTTKVFQKWKPFLKVSIFGLEFSKLISSQMIGKIVSKIADFFGKRDKNFFPKFSLGQFQYRNKKCSWNKSNLSWSIFGIVYPFESLKTASSNVF